jgi:hypothetical protein
VTPGVEQDAVKQKLSYVMSELTKMIIKHQGVVPELFTRNSQADATSLAQTLEANDGPEDSDDDEWVNMNDEGTLSRSIQIISRPWRMNTEYWEEYFGRFCNVKFESTRVLSCIRVSRSRIGEWSLYSRILSSPVLAIGHCRCILTLRPISNTGQFGGIRKTSIFS